MNPSSQRFISRHRAPRVQIKYTVETYGAEKVVEIPFITGVFADLSGAPKEPLPEVDGRKFLEFDVDNFDSRMKSAQPRVAFMAPNTLTGVGTVPVELIFESLDDFFPESVARRASCLSELSETRQLLKNLQTYSEGRDAAQKLIREILQDPELLDALTLFEEQAQPDSQERTLRIAARVRKEFGVQTPKAVQVIGKAIAALAGLRPQHPDRLRPQSCLPALVVELDCQISRQVNVILHHPKFQQLEATWRGLHYFVNHSETDATLKIRVFNVSKQELRRTLKKYKGTAWQDSPVFDKVYKHEHEQLGGEPFGLLVGDYAFDHSPPDLELLGEIANIASYAQVPFIAAASPSLLSLESWQELHKPRDLTKIFHAPEYALWRALRDTDQARYLALALPGALARSPYGPGADPLEELQFQEDVDPDDQARFVWMNAAYLMATNINRAFKRYGWCTRIQGTETGGVIEQLPVYQASTDTGVDSVGPTEIPISDRRAAELIKLGLMPLQQRKNSSLAAFLSAPSLQKPPEFDDPTATAAAKISAELPFVLASSRFAHYLRCICRDRAGSWSHTEEIAQWLNDWAKNYVDDDPAASSEESKARRPLAAAEVVLRENGDDPEHYMCRFFVRPQYQLEGLPVSVRLNILLQARRNDR
jgi:type VI secretion system protein ImpC